MIWQLSEKELQVAENLPNYNYPAYKIYEKISQVTQFTMCDNEEKFKKNCLELGPSWRYYDKPLEYKTNSFGYRSKEFDSICDNNFFIVYGCSHTFGEGLAIEETYSEIISNKLNMPYLNFGVCGGSPNTVWTNNILFFKNFKFLPKFVIIQWPDINRINITSKKGLIHLNPMSYDLDKSLTKVEKNLWHSIIEEENFQIQEFIMYYYSVNQLWNSKNIPVINFTICNKIFNYCKIDINFFDFCHIKGEARDNVHPGNEHNLFFANKILSKISIKLEKGQ
jgi:hypothetical protein